MFTLKTGTAPHVLRVLSCRLAARCGVRTGQFSTLFYISALTGQVLKKCENQAQKAGRACKNLETEHGRPGGGRALGSTDLSILSSPVGALKSRVKIASPPAPLSAASGTS